MGKLGWSEYQYYTSSPEGFYYACKGYFSKLEDESLATRKLANFVFQLGGGKGAFDTHWPLQSTVTQVDPPTADELRQLWSKVKKLHNKKK